MFGCTEMCIQGRLVVRVDQRGCRAVDYFFNRANGDIRVCQLCGKDGNLDRRSGGRG